MDQSDSAFSSTTELSDAKRIAQSILATELFASRLAIALDRGTETLPSICEATTEHPTPLVLFQQPQDTPPPPQELAGIAATTAEQRRREYAEHLRDRGAIVNGHKPKVGTYTILDMDARTCHYMTREERDVACELLVHNERIKGKLIKEKTHHREVNRQFFCGRVTEFEEPYCRTHMRVCYPPRVPRLPPQKSGSGAT